MAPHEVYTRELTGTYNRGHAIADPQPGLGPDRRPLPCVDIGDVGYIDHVNGSFIRLFNVHLDPDKNGQPGLEDLPENFDSVPLPRILTTELRIPTFNSRSVSKQSLGGNVDTSPLVNGSFAFTAASECGAILATPDPIESRSAQAVSIYQRLMKEHIEDWLEFTKGRLDLKLKLEDLMLVTGVDLTTSWATAVWSDTRFDAQIGLQIQYANTGLGLAAQLSWQHTEGATVNSGPVQSYDASGNAKVHPCNTVDRPINEIRNQCLFIRHIRAKRRPFRGLTLKGAAEANPDDDEGSSGDNNSTLDSPVIISWPERPEFTDCLEPALDFILQHSDAEIALVHYDDLALVDSERYGSFSNAESIIRKGKFGMFLRDEEPSHKSNDYSFLNIPVDNCSSCEDSAHNIGIGSEVIEDEAAEIGSRCSHLHKRSVVSNTNMADTWPPTPARYERKIQPHVDELLEEYAPAPSSQEAAKAPSWTESSSQPGYMARPVAPYSPPSLFLDPEDRDNEIPSGPWPSVQSNVNAMGKGRQPDVQQEMSGSTGWQSGQWNEQGTTWSPGSALLSSEQNSYFPHHYPDVDGQKPPPYYQNGDNSRSSETQRKLDTTIRNPGDFKDVAHKRLFDGPGSWRPDFRMPRNGLDAMFKKGKTFSLAIQERHPSELSPRLRYHPLTTAPVCYDMRQPPPPTFNQSTHFSFSSLHRAPTLYDPAGFATEPPLPLMRLYHPRLPWYIDVVAGDPVGVTLRELFDRIWETMTQQVRESDYWNSEVEDEERSKIERAFNIRCSIDPMARQGGVKKVDFMMRECIFLGLSKGREGMYEMRTRKI